MNDEELLFPSYNAMSRPATFLGVPILPFVGIAVALLVVGTVGFLLFPWWGGVALGLAPVPGLGRLFRGEFIRRPLHAPNRLRHASFFLEPEIRPRGVPDADQSPLECVLWQAFRTTSSCRRKLWRR